jgi:Glyoxalase-like domain
MTHEKTVSRPTRRSFLALSGALALHPLLRQRSSDVPPLVDQVPPLLDHILLGSSDLERGMAFVHERTGVRPAFGGVHPGRGTQNALLSLGTRRYLEVIAPDPAQHGGSPLAARLAELREPRLVGWAAHRADLETFAGKLKSAGVAAEGPTPGSRKRPDGKLLHWRTLTLRDDAGGLLPFFIEWGADSPHPSGNAPSGCGLLRFELLSQDPAGLAKLAARLALEVPVAANPRSELRAVIQGPGGSLSVSS